MEASVQIFDLRGFIVLILLSSVLSACKIGQKAHSFFSPISENELTVINNSKFIDAISFKNSGDYEKAIELLNQIIKSKGDKAPAYFELAKIYSLKSKNEKALEFINNAVDLNSNNKWYLNYKINLTKGLELYDECEKAYLLRRKKFPANTDYEIELSDFYIDREQYLKALKILNQLEVKVGVSHNINFNKFLLYRGLNDYDKCEKEIEKLIFNFPSNTNYYIQFADFKFEHGEDDDALGIYNKALDFNPDNPYILYELANYHFLNHQKEKAKPFYIQVVRSPEFRLSEKHKVLLKFKRLSEFDKSLNDFTKSIMVLAADLHPDNSSINLITADFIFDSRNYSESIKYYKRVVDSNPNDYLSWFQLITSYYNISNYSEMLKNSSEAILLFPTQPSLYLFSGIANVQLKKYSDAVEVLQDGNELVFAKDKKLKAQFLSSLGDAFHAVGKHKLSDQSFELSLELESENYFVLNNYAYYLSERNINLDKAKKMSHKSNLLNPNQASFQDTYAWILFQLGEYQESLDWLKKSILNGGGKSHIINQHIGDVYQKLDQRDEAEKYWNKAKKIQRDSNEEKNELK